MPPFYEEADGEEPKETPKKFTYVNLVSCGNCKKHVEVSKTDTCAWCGMMICGKCGQYCRHHKDPKNRV